MLAAGADGDVDETLRVSFAHYNPPDSGDAHQGVRRPPPRCRFVAQRDRSDSGRRVVQTSWDSSGLRLYGIREKHDCFETMFLTDSFGYRTGLSRLGLNGRVDYTDRNLIEKWFHTLKIRVDCFHNSWVGSRLSVHQWLAIFVHYYDFQRPHQSLGGRTPAREVNYTVLTGATCGLSIRSGPRRPGTGRPGLGEPRERSRRAVRVPRTRRAGTAGGSRVLPSVYGS